LRRSDFNRRIFKPAVEGDVKCGLVPVQSGLTFHGLRHSRKIWLSTDHVPEIASAKRLGHHVSDKLEEVYTHMAPKMEGQIMTVLQRLWKHAQHAAVAPGGNRPHTRHDSFAQRRRPRVMPSGAGQVGQSSTRGFRSGEPDVERSVSLNKRPPGALVRGASDRAFVRVACALQSCGVTQHSGGATSACIDAHQPHVAT
jgi:hypothetical protein